MGELPARVYISLVAAERYIRVSNLCEGKFSRQGLPFAGSALRAMEGTQMTKIAKAWLGLKADLRGVTALEYALIASFIALAVVAGASLLGGNIGNPFTKVAGQLAT